MDLRYPYQLPPLPYSYTALSGAISEQTLHFHHDKHFQTYLDNLNTALSDAPELQSKSLIQLLSHPEDLPEGKRTAVINNGGGVYNHALYFAGLTPCPITPAGTLRDALNAAFGTLEAFQDKLRTAALAQFGSGYAFLVCDREGRLSIQKTANQDSPLSSGAWPVLCVDVWEHAYYLDYQNRRAAYVDRWMEHINWDCAAQQYSKRSFR